MSPRNEKTLVLFVLSLSYIIFITIRDDFKVMVVSTSKEAAIFGAPTRRTFYIVAKLIHNEKILTTIMRPSLIIGPDGVAG